MSFNVLVVDDSPLARRIVLRALRVAGLELGEVHEARDGCEALEVLAARWVDVVFTDVHMPRMSGHALVERMAADRLLQSVPVVVITSERSQARRDALLKLGARALLNKPLAPEAIRAVVREVLPEGAAGGDHEA